MTTKIDLFSKVGSKAPTKESALAMAEEVGPEYVGIRRADAAVTVRAAYATYHAITSGWVVDGRVPEAKRPAGSLTFTEYAEKFYGRSDGSIITRWYSLGCALVLHGVTPDKPLWKALNGDAKGAERGTVRKVLADPKASQAKIKAALTDVGINPTTGVKVKTEKTTPQAAGGRPNDGTTPAPATPSTAGVLKDTETLLSQATGAMAKASPTTRAKYRDMLAANLAKVDGIIAADKGTPRSTGGTGISVPTPASVAAKAAKAALPATGTDG